jgi:hypothetical protein
LFGRVQEDAFATEHHLDKWVLSNDEINGWILFEKTEPLWTILWSE